MRASHSNAEIRTEDRAVGAQRLSLDPVLRATNAGLKGSLAAAVVVAADAIAAIPVATVRGSLPAAECLAALAAARIE